MTRLCDNCGAQIIGDPEIECLLCESDVWPAWAKWVARFRKPGEVGVGDTVQRIAARFGGEKFKRLSKRIGLPCGCTERQADWNRLYPYD